MHEIHFDLIDSTQTYAKSHVEEFPKQKITCISANTQTAGRGRFQNAWISPPDVNLYATFYLQLPSNTMDLTSLAQLLALSAASVLIEKGFQPKIKWPNDIQLNEKKICGVLCETSFKNEFVDLFLGIGLNINMQAADLATIDQPATSLKEETKKNWNVKNILKDLQSQFSYDLEIFKKKGFAPFCKSFENILAYKGKNVRCFDGHNEWVGICHSLTRDGRLNLLLPNQTIHSVQSGEIHLRSII